MELSYLLKNALKDIDILEEYYSNQCNTTVLSVKEELDKCKFGFAIYKYLCGRFHNEEKPHCLNSNEMEFIEKEIEIIESGDDNKIFQYKLKNAEKFTEYEMDPYVAEKKTSYLKEQPITLNNSIVIMLLIKYENAISALYKELLQTFPDAYLKEKSITYSELVSINSNIEDIKKTFIENEIDEFMRKPLKEWYSTFEQKHKVHFEYGELFEQFKEIYYRRNIIVHNQGRANNSYIDAVHEKYKCAVGKRLTPSIQYIKGAFDCTRIVVLETFIGMAKLAEDKKSFAERLFSTGYDYMLKRKWMVSKYIFNSINKIEGQSEADVWCNNVNYFVSCKNLDGLDSIKEEVEKMDVSLMKPRLAIAKPALLDRFSDVSESLEGLIENGISVNEIKTWPLLIQYRNSDAYKQFTERHIEEFEIESCNADDISCISNNSGENGESSRGGLI